MAKPPGEDPAVLHRKAQVRVLSMLALGEDDVFELLSALAAYNVRHHFTPDVALLEVAATALGLAVPPGAEPLEYEGLTDRYLPDQMLTGRTLRQRTQYAIDAAACLRGGLLPDRGPVSYDVTPEPTRHLGADPHRAAFGRTAPVPAAACDVYELGVRTDLVTACRIALGIGSTTAYALAGRGELPFPAYRVGRQWVVPTAGLLTFLGLPAQKPIP
jgi:hypothetical protein